MTLSTSMRLILDVLEDLDSAVSLSCAIKLRYGDIAGIMQMRADPGHYSNALSYYLDCQALALFHKRRDLVVPGIDRRDAALKKWRHGEAECYRTNERLAKFFFPTMLDESERTIYAFIKKVRRTLVHWVGHKPPSLDEIEGRFGPGATFSDRGRLTTVPDKMSSTPTLTRQALWYVLPYLKTKWGRINCELGVGYEFSRGNRFAVVPKTAVIDRCIAIEPAINLFYQLGLGTSLRRRLQKATSWDLDSAQDVHRRMALQSSVDKRFCTLDLSNASDTVCKELVRLLMPPAWFEELDALRSPSTYVDGKWVVLEKFSSMGNGFTFELETLIFAATLATLLQEEGASGLLGHDVFVFGDDIMVPEAHVRSATAVLRYFGFSLNETKSFSGDHPFRESCGADFFEGVDVRPYFLKDAVNDPYELFPIINGIRRIYDRLGLFGIVRSYRGWLHLLDCLPSVLRQCRGPSDLGDTVIHDDFQRWRFKWKFGIRYFRANVRVNKRIAWSHWRPPVVLASALYGVSDGALGVTPRDSPYSYKVTWVPCS